MKAYATLTFLLLAVGCFNPNYRDGNLQCGPGASCPAGMMCFVDGLCYTHQPIVIPDASAPETSTAADVTPEAPVVKRQFLEPCDAFGSGTPSRTDNCDTGLVCVDGNVGSTCLRRCTTGLDCGGMTCEQRQVDLQVAATSLICGLPATTCDPVGGVTGCLSGRTCYLEAGRTICEITTGEGANSSCLHSRECLPHYTCASSGPGFGRCLPACANGSLCPGATVCQVDGYCF
jgi:hypothetical protein